MRFDEEWLEAYQKRMRESQGVRKSAVDVAAVRADLEALDGGPKAGQKRTKYGNRETRRGDKRFDSKHEAAVYEELRLRCLAGEYLGLGLQVPFYLPGGIKYIADFVAFLPGGGYIVMDAKSEATRKDKVYRLKKKQMAACLGLEIVEK